MLVLTLDRMAAGGMFDQLGGGFARYSTDGAWHVPHFEKMLYDNAQLAQVYTRTWLVTGEERLREVAIQTFDYLLRELRQPEGGFSSSQDADTEGVEGGTFTWTWDELTALVGEPVAEAFGAAPEGNWEGTNVLRAPVAIDAIAERHGADPEELRRAVAAGRDTLFAARRERAQPGVDDKVLTAWNALAIRALAEAGRAFDEPRYVEAAVACGTFVHEHLRDASGRLLRSWRDGAGEVLGFADDHALLAGAFLTLYETTFDLRWFTAARELCRDLVRLFSDEERGGFFQTGTDGEHLVVRPKDLYDNAVPGGNSAAAESLLRLALFTGDAGVEREGTRALALVRDAMAAAPTAFGLALVALDLLVGPSREIAIVGEPDDAATRALVRTATEGIHAERRARGRASRRRDRRGGDPAAGRPDAGERPTGRVRVRTVRLRDARDRAGRAGRAALSAEPLEPRGRRERGDHRGGLLARPAGSARDPAVRGTGRLPGGTARARGPSP